MGRAAAMVLVAVLAAAVVAIAGESIPHPHCNSCLAVAAAAGQDGAGSVAEVCGAVLGSQGCRWLEQAPRLQRLVAVRDAAGERFTPRGICRAVGQCQLEDVPAQPPLSPVDVRVTKGLGAYEAVRFSAITEKSRAAGRPRSSPLFPYSKPFAFRWTNMHLQSGIQLVKPGATTAFEVGNTTVSVTIPVENAPTRGIIIADPCFSSKWIPCNFGDHFQTLERLPALLNAAMKEGAHSSGIDFWAILGDNFYDRTGELTTAFFDRLTLGVKSTLFAAVPGNHDYWVEGFPTTSSDSDQFSNGFLQFYPQDTVAATNQTVEGDFLDLSVDPDKGDTAAAKLPAIANTIWYHKLGNLGVAGFSGAYRYSEAEPFLKEACAWLGTQELATALLVGHWNEDNAGCTDMDVNRIYTRIRAMPGCAALGSRLKFFVGHTHCNKVVLTEDNLATGFMVAGQGMIGCGNFGIPVVDTHGGRLQVLYFSVGTLLKPSHQYEAILSCFKAHPVHHCYHLADVWLNQSIPALLRP